MKLVRAFLLLGLPVLLSFVLAGCQTGKPTRFRGSDQASIVLQYSSWDYIFMTKPLYQEGDFLRQIHRPELAGVLDQLNVARETAVISVGWQYDQKTLQQLLGDWKQLLKQCGFRRAVFVRGNSSTSVEHAIIIEDANLI